MEKKTRDIKGEKGGGLNFENESKNPYLKIQNKKEQKVKELRTTIQDGREQKRKNEGNYASEGKKNDPRWRREGQRKDGGGKEKAANNQKSLVGTT